MNLDFGWQGGPLQGQEIHKPKDPDRQGMAGRVTSPWKGEPVGEIPEWRCSPQGEPARWPEAWMGHRDAWMGGEAQGIPGHASRRFGSSQSRS